MNTRKSVLIGVLGSVVMCLFGMLACTPAQPPQSGDRLEFWETYENAEILPYLRQLDASDNLLHWLVPCVDAEEAPRRGPVIGYATIQDTAAVNAILASEAAKAVLPRMLRCRWTVKPVDRTGEIFELVALKTKIDGSPAMNGEQLTLVKVQKEKWGPALSMEMNEEGARVWQRLTKDNIGKSIALVIEDKVYSYPVVQMEIPNGRLQISGNFSEEELQQIADMLNNPR